MIGYVTVGTNDPQRAAAFYDALIGGPDVKKVQPNDRVWLWIKKGAPMFGIAVPFDGEKATIGNGTMIALTVDSPEQVAAMYAKAIELGAADEGAPGPRGASGFYGGYCRDLDGNKLALFCMVKG